MRCRGGRRGWVGSMLFEELDWMELVRGVWSCIYLILAISKLTRVEDKAWLGARVDDWFEAC